MQFGLACQRIGSQRFGHAQCAIAAECAKLKDVVGIGKAAEHLEYASLQMSAAHAAVGETKMSETLNLMQELGFSIYVLQHILVEC